MSKTILAWHFANVDGTPRCGNPLPRKIETGAEFSVKGPLEMCKNGMHASIKALDALRIVERPLVSRVELSGQILTGDDKLCARTRKHLWTYDAGYILHEFACRVAEHALLKARAAGREPDERCWNAIAVTRKWIAGNAAGVELDAARHATSAAASAAAWDAAWDAAMASEAAAWAAAMSAARDTAQVAGNAAWAAAWASMSAAWAAAWASMSAAEAAKDAAGAAQNTLLEQMLTEGWEVFNA